MAIEKLKEHKSPSIDQILAELIKVGGTKFALRSINLLILFEIKKNCLRNGKSRPLYPNSRRAIKQNIV
jgi:hypothetical protein